METIIKSLIELQGCDFELRMIQEKKAKGPVRILALEEELKQVEDQADEEISKAEAIKKEKRQTDQTIADLEAQIEKSKVKLSNIKSNKEYGAALKEIEDLEREKATCEDRALQIMEALESLDEKYSASQELNQTQREQLEADEKEVQKEMKTLEKACKKHEKQKKRIRKEIDEELLTLYDNICDHKEGIAITSVLKGVCQTCHMGMPPQKFNELMRGDVLMNCPHCGRIMYWGEDERYSDTI